VSVHEGQQEHEYEERRGTETHLALVVARRVEDARVVVVRRTGPDASSSSGAGERVGEAVVLEARGPSLRAEVAALVDADLLLLLLRLLLAVRRGVALGRVANGEPARLLLLLRLALLLLLLLLVVGLEDVLAVHRGWGERVQAGERWGEGRNSKLPSARGAKAEQTSRRRRTTRSLAPSAGLECS